MFCIDDTVWYGIDGLCRITDKTVLTVGNEKKDYLVLSPVHENLSVIYVPLDNKALLAKMRAVIRADEVEALLDAVAKEPPLAWITEEPRRRDRWRAILQSGDRRELLRLIKTIHWHSVDQKAHGRKLHHMDDTVMKDAERLLYGEFGYVLNIPVDDVLPYILSRLDA